ncbi:MAG: glycosyltransferase, partial [Bacteroidota bacterium]
MQQQKRIFFTVLDWGLGHATRSIPIIEALLLRGHDVHLAGEGNSLLLLKNHFPNLKAHSLFG